MERFEEVRQREPRVRHSRQDYAHAVSSYEATPSVDTRFSDEDGLEPELPWVADLPEGDRRLFAVEMSRLMAEAAETDDFAEVDQALRDWRVTSLTYSDPELRQIFSQPRIANGDRVPRPVI